MRILHFIPSLEPEAGGPSRALLEICAATELVEPRAEVTIVSSRRGITTDWLEEMRAQLPTHTRLRLFNHWGTHTRLVSPRALYWILDHVDRFDVVHVHGALHPMSTLAGTIARCRGVPYVVRPLGTLSTESLRHGHRHLKRFYLHAVERANLERAAAVQFTTELELAEAGHLRLDLRPAVIPVPVSLATAARTGRRDTNHILFLGRLHRIKGLELLLSALARLSRRFPRARLSIAGTGEPAYEREVRSLARHLGLGQRVRFLGHVTGPDKKELLMRSGILVLPSHHESFGVAVVEAMAAGMPVVISRRVGVWPSVERARAGITVDLGVRPIAESLASLLGDDTTCRAMGARGRAAVEHEFAPAAVGQRLLRLYERCMAPAGDTDVWPVAEEDGELPAFPMAATGAGRFVFDSPAEVDAR